jgi:hypothetical protein
MRNGKFDLDRWAAELDETGCAMTDSPRYASGRRPAVISGQALRHFDPDEWIALLAEQRRQIAGAAGVDPSKVKIHIGH